MLRIKWRPEAPVTLELPDGEVTSTCDEIQDALARHNFRQFDEVVQTATPKTDDPDLFDIEEIQFTNDLMAHDKAQGHD